MKATKSNKRVADCTATAASVTAVRNRAKACPSDIASIHAHCIMHRRTIATEAIPRLTTLHSVTALHDETTRLRNNAGRIVAVAERDLRKVNDTEPRLSENVLMTARANNVHMTSKTARTMAKKRVAPRET